MSLKVGDRVKVTKGTFADVPVGAVGTLVAFEPGHADEIYVDLDDYPDPLAGVFKYDGWAFMDYEVELIEGAA